MRIYKDTIEWAAGIFEGEGCIYRHQKRRLFIMVVKMKDEDIIKRFYSVVKVGRVTSRKIKEPYNYPFWEWILTRTNDILKLANILLPFMGERRTEQILKAIKDVKPVKERQILKEVPECGYMKKGEISNRGAHKHVRIGEKPCTTCAENQRLYIRNWRKAFFNSNR